MTPTDADRKVVGKWMRQSWGHESLQDMLAELVAVGRAEGLETAAKELDRRAGQYQEPDGEPGILGYNCWGWRTIASGFREAAAAIRYISPKPYPEN